MSPDFTTVVTQSPIACLNQEKQGIKEFTHQLDAYRAGLEIATSLAMSEAGMTDFNPDNRIQVLDSINDFLARRIQVAANIALANHDFIQAGTLLKRVLLWSKSDDIRARIRHMEPEVVTGAAYQAVRERFALLGPAKRCLLCDISNPDVVRDGLAHLAPDMPVTECDLAGALADPEREACLMLTENEPSRAALLASGLAPGRVMLIADLLRIFRITG
ncbi:MAG: hypothetical protein HQL96_00725 [Magnetococcales bacterium]|nr:hypothetical protein [Magnetococcales bacterium]